VRGLVELHGGSVEPRSGGIGMGSEFVVRLPVAKKAEPTAQGHGGNGETSHSKKNCRVLVVDDNRDSADSLAMLLRMMGHDTRTSHDGPDAIEAAATFRPDVVLLDIGLPTMDGYEVARHIRRRDWGKDMLLTALTGWGQDEDRRRSQVAGIDHHLTKPVDPAALMQLLDSRSSGNPHRR
jgi:CheY-like chemotaxis protein